MSYHGDGNNGRKVVAVQNQRDSQDPRLVSQQMGNVHVAHNQIQPTQVYQYAQPQYANPAMIRSVPQMNVQQVHGQVIGHPQGNQGVPAMYSQQQQQQQQPQQMQQGQGQAVRMIPVAPQPVMMYQQYQPKMNISELVQVPSDLTAFASDPQFQQILWRVKEQTGINIITLNRNPQSQEVESVAIDAPSKDSAQLARSLIETHFKLHARLKQAETRLHKVQNDLFTTQGEVASGMTVEFTIDPELVGLALGKKGARIKQIEHDTKVSSIHVAGDSGRIIVTGPDAASVNSAREQMELQEGCIPLESRQVEWLSSRNTNAMLADIKDGADLLVVRVNQEKFTLDIVGTATAVRNAQLVIQTQMEYVDKQIEIEKVENATWDKLRQFRKQYGIGRNEGGRGGGRGGGDYGAGRGGGRGGGAGNRGGDYRRDNNQRDSLLALDEDKPATNARRSGNAPSGTSSSGANMQRTVGSTAEQREKAAQAAMLKSKGGNEGGGSNRGGKQQQQSSGGLRHIVASPEPKKEEKNNSRTVAVVNVSQQSGSKNASSNNQSQQQQQQSGNRQGRSKAGDKSQSVDTLAAELKDLKVKDNSGNQNNQGKNNRQGGNGGSNNRPATAPAAPAATETKGDGNQQSSRRRKVEEGNANTLVTPSGIKLEIRDDKGGKKNGVDKSPVPAPAVQSTEAPLPKRENNRRGGDKKKDSNEAPAATSATNEKKEGSGRREKDNTTAATTSGGNTPSAEKKEGRGSDKKNGNKNEATAIAGATLRDALKINNKEAAPAAPVEATA